MIKRYFVPCLVLLLLAAFLAACGPASTQSPPLNQKREVSQEDIALAKQLLADKKLEATDRLVAAVANDMRRLENSFWREAVAIEEVQAFDILYSITYDVPGVKDLIRVTEDGSGPINVTVINGEIKDVWVYRSSGQIVFNGQSMWTRSKDTTAGHTTIQPAPDSPSPQTPAPTSDSQSIVSDPKALAVQSVPLPKPPGELTLSSLCNALAVSVTDSLEAAGCSASGMDCAAAVGAALAEKQALASGVLSGCKTAEGPSYKLYQYYEKEAPQDIFYCVETYQNSAFSGDHFVWELLEHRP